ncbi:MAG: PIN domain-containing protein [Balneolaceae bacterium]|nr:PIN domain-containing protein [Balneolaceae bacterium]
MEILDANFILRYLLKDHKIFYTESKEIIEKQKLFVPTEVVAEIVYVLDKVYNVPAAEITSALKALFNYSIIVESSGRELFLSN